MSYTKIVQKNSLCKDVSAMTARQKFGELLDQVYYCDDQFIVKRAQKPMAVLISINLYHQFLQQRAQDFAVLDQIWAKIPKFPAQEVEKDINKAIADLRTGKNQ